MRACMPVSECLHIFTNHWSWFNPLSEAPNTNIGEFMLKSEPEKTCWLLSEEKIKATGEWVQRMYVKRKSVIYKVIN